MNLTYIKWLNSSRNHNNGRRGGIFELPLVSYNAHCQKTTNHFSLRISNICYFEGNFVKPTDFGEINMTTCELPGTRKTRRKCSGLLRVPVTVGWAKRSVPTIGHSRGHAVLDGFKF